MDGGIGPQGQQGRDGDIGPQGQSGRDGIDGPQGVPGKDGRDGIGAQGVPGKDGHDGIQGPAGAQGEKGDKGLNGKSWKDSVSVDHITIVNNASSPPEIDLSSTTTLLTNYNYQKPTTFVLPTPLTEETNAMCHLQLANRKVAPVHIRTTRGSFILGSGNGPRSVELSYLTDHWEELYTSGLPWFVDTLQRRFIPETSTSQKYGQSVAISADGNTIAVGSPDDTPSGSVSVYIRHADNIWTQQASRLIGSRGTPGAQQGCAVALSADGNVLAVGGKGCTSNSGSTWLFIRDAAGVWKQQGDKLVGTGAVGYSQQGCSVALSADGLTLAVGGSADNSNMGATWIFSRNSSNEWVQHGTKLIGSESKDQALQGCSVSLSSSGDILAVGGSGDSMGMGSTWVFTRMSGVWVQMTEKLVGDAGKTASQGTSVALSGNGKFLAVGGISDGSMAGAVWMFIRKVDNGWMQFGEKITCDGALDPSTQGSALALSGDGLTLAIAGSNDNSGTGTAWLFTFDGETYVQRAKIADTSIGANGSEQGTSIAMNANGTTLVVGAPLYNPNPIVATPPTSTDTSSTATTVTPLSSGAVYVYV